MKGKVQIMVKGECSVKRGEEVKLERGDKISGENKMEEIGYMRSLFLMQNTFHIIYVSLYGKCLIILSKIIQTLRDKTTHVNQKYL